MTSLPLNCWPTSDATHLGQGYLIGTYASPSPDDQFTDPQFQPLAYSGPVTRTGRPQSADS
jgi:hypothetical protein